MPKLYSARVILAALKRAEFSIISQKGSHIKLSKRISKKVLTVITGYWLEILDAGKNIGKVKKEKVAIEFTAASV